MLELRYPKAIRVAKIRLFEVGVAGAVVAVELADKSGGKRQQWSVDDTLLRPGTFVVTPPATIDFAASIVRVHLDTKRVQGRKQGKGRCGIDTVQIVAANGDWQWPIHASARRLP